jgi:hypothetical protein
MLTWQERRVAALAAKVIAKDLVRSLNPEKLARAVECAEKAISMKREAQALEWEAVDILLGKKP